MTELDVAREIASGAAASPQKFGNAWLIALRLTGTGLADRPALGERVWRDPAVWLSNETIARCSGLPVILDHPKKASLDTDEFADRSIGAVLHPYVADRQGIENTDGPDLWAVARVFADDDLMEEIATQSTSPAVVFQSSDGNQTITLPDGTECLVEASPTLIDHVAIVADGVWDKSTPDRGVRIDNERTTEMDEDTATEPAADKSRKDSENNGVEPDKILAALGDIAARLDALEKRRPDAKKDAEVDAEERGTGEPKRVAADKARKDAAEAEFAAETARADAQARADAVASAFGEKAPPPLSGEAVSAYRARLARRYQKYSQDFANVNLQTLADSAAFDGIEKKIYADALVASLTPDVPVGQLIERKSHLMGREISTFHGQGTFIGLMKRPSRHVTKIRTAADHSAARWI